MLWMSNRQTLHNTINEASIKEKEETIRFIQNERYHNKTLASIFARILKNFQKLNYIKIRSNKHIARIL